ncbi:Uncharacterised protein [uncultured archaeon]|nr:Uncharacterised protein [uncultured archaeon]
MRYAPIILERWRRLGTEQNILDKLREIDPKFGKVKKTKEADVDWGKKKQPINPETPFTVYGENEYANIEDGTINKETAKKKSHDELREIDVDVPADEVEES